MVHFGDGPERVDCALNGDTVEFEADGFSVYVIVTTVLKQTLTASDGRTYEISVTYTEEAKLPDDVELVVREIAETDSSFATVFGRAKNAATSAREDATVTNARFFDISLKKDGATLEPLAPVEVNIVLKSGIALSDATSVVHFINSRKVEVVEAETVPVDEKVCREHIQISILSRTVEESHR